MRALFQLLLNLFGAAVSGKEIVKAAHDLQQSHMPQRIVEAVDLVLTAGVIGYAIPEVTRHAREFVKVAEYGLLICDVFAGSASRGASGLHFENSIPNFPSHIRWMLY